MTDVDTWYGRSLNGSPNQDIWFYNLVVANDYDGLRESVALAARVRRVPITVRIKYDNGENEQFVVEPNKHVGRFKVVFIMTPFKVAHSPTTVKQRFLPYVASTVEDIENLFLDRKNLYNDIRVVYYLSNGNEAFNEWHYNTTQLELMGPITVSKQTGEKLVENYDKCLTTIQKALTNVGGNNFNPATQAYVFTLFDFRLLEANRERIIRDLQRVGWTDVKFDGHARCTTLTLKMMSDL